MKWWDEWLWVCVAWRCARWMVAHPCGGVRGKEFYRVIRTARLRRLPDFHLRPIDVLVLHGP